MSIYAYQNGTLKPLDNSDRVWIGTKAAWTALGDDQPKGCLVAFTDDYEETVITGTGTRNTAYVSSENFIADWYQIGRICMVNLQLNTSAASTSSEELVTGFPVPIAPIAVVAQGNDNEVVGGLVLKANGAIRTHYGCSSGKFFHITFTYITAD